MTEEILETIESLEEIQLESELMTLDKLGVQLVKEYYMEELNVFQESGNTSRKKHETVQDDGHVPTINRIIDWFVRIINRIRSHFLRSHADRLIKRIRKLDRYEMANVFEGVMVDEKWYKENVSDVLGLRDANNHHAHGSGLNLGSTTALANGRGYGPKNDTLLFYLALLVPNMVNSAGLDPVTKVFDHRLDFTRVARSIGKLREKLQDSAEEIGRLSSVNENGPLKHRHHIGKDSDTDVALMKARGDNDDYVNRNAPGMHLRLLQANHERGEARNVEVFLDSISVTNDVIKNALDLIHKGIPEMRKQANQLASQNLNRSRDIQRRQEAYTHAMTDLGRALMYVTQIQVTILQWMRWTLGPEHGSNSVKDV